MCIQGVCHRDVVLTQPYISIIQEYINEVVWCKKPVSVGGPDR